MAEGYKKERTVVRRIFSKIANELDTKLDQDGKTVSVDCQILHRRLEETEKNLRELDKLIKDTITATDFEEDIYEKEVEDANKYRGRWIYLDTRIKMASTSPVSPTKKDTSKLNYKLPKLKFATFNGDIRNWLNFWGQFKIIDKDVSLDDEDKYQYLCQSMEDGTDVKALVESFPPSSYKECLEQLKSRYARDELLIQVYVRELLALVLIKSEKKSITALYDKLSAQLRALEFLGVAKDKFAAFLLPMVESALPQEILLIWERAKAHNKDATEELAKLLEFLKKEVESEQRISIARKTFSKESESCEIRERRFSTGEPTAGCLLTSVKTKQTCVWCDKDSHVSIECYKVQKMSIEERREHLKKKKACAVCLKRGHHAKFCKTYVKCLICGRRHSVVLCPGKEQEEKSDYKVAANVASSDPSTSTSANLSSLPKNGSTTLLQTVAVILSHGNKQIIARALFDSGAQRSYIRDDLAAKLNIPVTGEETLSHALFGGVETTSKQYKVYNVEVQSLDKQFKFKLIALGQPCICNNVPSYSSANFDLPRLLRGHNITLTDATETDVGLLIGADFSGLVLTNSIVPLRDSLVAVKTKLGWTLQGKISGRQGDDTQAANVAMFCTSDSPISNFWSLELWGVRDPVETKNKAQREEEVMARFEDTVTVNNEGRYEVYLPWKEGHDDLLSNFDLAARRLESVTKKMKTTDNLYADYDKVFSEWKELGIIERVTNPDIDRDSSHYLPHRPVIKNSSLTTRVRPVFDASAKDKRGRSLNSCLEKGVNLLDHIPKLLTGFRTGKIGVTADIAKAFLQISITPSERNFLRFLWWDNDKLITFRHCRVVFGLTSSPFLLSASIQHHLNKITGKLKKSADLLAKSFYVDNCIVSLESEDEVRRFKYEARLIMDEGKFDLRQWVTSPMSDAKQNSVESVLGLEWHTAEDELGCSMKSFPQCYELGSITKRNVLSLCQRVFDPIGFLSPVTLVPRLILQEAWRRQISWDEKLPNDLEKRFMNWYEYVHLIKDCKIPRRLTVSNINQCTLELHMFCDASKDGYAACVFLRAEKNDIVSVRLMSAKSRIAPPEKMTIPRLELLAALIGSRLLSEARKDLKIACSERCWTDSGVALCWIKRELPWNTYVGNRVKEIRENTNPVNWYHIPGTYNWADLPSRGCDAKQLLSSRWWEGPSWLTQNSEKWPSSPLVEDEEEAKRELKKTVCFTNVCVEESLLSQLNYFSKYTKIIRTVAWILRFLYNTRYPNKIKGELSYEEFEKAEKEVIKIIQLENTVFIESKIKGLTYFYDSNDGLLKIKTKLLLSDVPECTKCPIVIPATCFLARRIVEQRHAYLQHAGVNIVLADIRSKYWIIGARQLVKSVISRCTLCRRHRAKPVQSPTAPLPVDRTQCSTPFEITGVDLAGPLFLRDGSKCWIVLYTCAVYRAVHLELTQSLSTEAFLMTLRRFIARRGRVSVMLSDNGTNFIGTKNLLQSLDWDRIQQESTIQRIKWKLNAPTAAWWGGFWERIIRVLKDLLKRILGKSSVSYEELQTILCDCEATLNGRPLTYIEDEKSNSLEPLTPLHFLQPIATSEVTDLDVIDGFNLNKRLRYIQNLREDFRKRFRAEYLTTLVQRGKEKKDSLVIGDVVIVEAEGKRVKWPLGIVVELYEGRDGIGRTAKVKTSTGYKVRPVQRLYKLEVGNPDVEIPQTGLKVTRSGRVVRMPSRYGV